MQRREFILGALVSALARAARSADFSEVRQGQILPDVALRGLNGPSRRLSEYRGRPLLINMWASWCGPCREEMASLERLAWTPRASGFRVIGVTTDDDPAAALAFMRAANSTISQYIDHDLQMETLLGARKIPLTVLIDSRGRLIARVAGAQQWDSPALIRQLDKAFGLKDRGG